MTEKGDSRLGPLDLLYQDKVWQGRQDGELVLFQLDEMTASHLENLRSWLLSRAKMLHSMEVSALYGMAAHVNGEQAGIDLDRAIGTAEEEDPREWIREQPLFQAITRRLHPLPKGATR